MLAFFYNTIIIFMICKDDLLFFKEWTSYLKGGELRRLDIVFARSPSNTTQLVFLLQIATQLRILMALDIESITQHNVLLPFSSATLGCFQAEYKGKMVNYAMSLLEVWTQIGGKVNNKRQQSKKASLLVSVLSVLNHPQLISSHKGSLSSLLTIGQLCFLAQHKFSYPLSKFLALARDSWAIGRFLFAEGAQSLASLLVIWSLSQNQKYQIRKEKSEIIIEWFTMFLSMLQGHKLNKSQIHLQIVSLRKEIAFLLSMTKQQIKNIRVVIGQLVKILFSNFQKESLTIEDYINFAISFEVINCFSTESTRQMHQIIPLKQTINYQRFIYSAFWWLQSYGLIHQFLSFYSFIREHSMYSILQIYRKNDSKFKLKSIILAQKYTTQKFYDLLVSQKMLALQFFNVLPLNSAKVVLDYYLKKSGIIMSKLLSEKIKKAKRAHIKQPPVYDPLHFLLIKAQFWEHQYHRKFLQISLWISLNAYCYWINNEQKMASMPEKKKSQYIKKLNLAILIFCLSLDKPTRLLQYQPVESDSLKELFAQPIFPNMILKNKYFFQSYDWENDKIIPKKISGIQNWIIPWGNLLTNPKNIFNIFFYERGYQLAYVIAVENKAAFERVYGDFFVTNIMQILGINLSNLAQSRSKIEYLPKQRKKYMILLLKQSQRLQEKTALLATKLLQILQ